jgi:hypothetical protein
LQCREEMGQAREGKAREPAGASDGAAVVEGWEAVELVWVENVYAPIAAIGQLTKQARPVTR